MAENEPLSEQIEQIIAGVLRFATRFATSFWFLAVRQSLVVDAVFDNHQSLKILTPKTFLFASAVLLGFLGQTLVRGLTSINYQMLAEVADFNLVSFLNYSLPVFLIALVAGGVSRYLLPPLSAENKANCSQLLFYFIGFFGVSALVVLVVLSFVLQVFSGMLSGTLPYFKWVAGIFLYSYVAFVFYLGMSLLLKALAKCELPLRWFDYLKLFALVVCLIFACAINFTWSAQASPLSARFVEMTEYSENSYRVTLLVENDSNSNLLINLEKNPVLYFDAAQQSAIVDAVACSQAEKLSSTRGLLIVESGKATLLELCFRKIMVDALISHLPSAQAVTVVEGRTHTLDMSGLTLSAELNISFGDRRDGPLTLPLQM